VVVVEEMEGVGEMVEEVVDMREEGVEGTTVGVVVITGKETATPADTDDDTDDDDVRETKCTNCSAVKD